MRRPRLCAYYRYLIGEWVEPLPAVVLVFATSATIPAQVRHGIRILDSLSQTRADFVRVIEEALSLIQRTDPLRFSRVKREIRTIDNSIGQVGPFYMRPLRLAGVNLRYFRRVDDPVAFIASILVHNATLGHLYTHWVLRNDRNRDRVDVVCAREADRFMRRLGMTSTPWENLSQPSLWEQITCAKKDLAESWRESHQNEHASSGSGGEQGGAHGQGD